MATVNMTGTQTEKEKEIDISKLNFREKVKLAKERGMDQSAIPNADEVEKYLQEHTSIMKRVPPGKEAVPVENENVPWQEAAAYALQKINFINQHFTGDILVYISNGSVWKIMFGKPLARGSTLGIENRKHDDPKNPVPWQNILTEALKESGLVTDAYSGMVVFAVLNGKMVKYELMGRNY